MKKNAKWIKNTWWRNCFHETRALDRNARDLGGDGEIMERNEVWAGRAQESGGKNKSRKIIVTTEGKQGRVHKRDYWKQICYYLYLYIVLHLCFICISSSSPSLCLLLYLFVVVACKGTLLKILWSIKYEMVMKERRIREKRIDMEEKQRLTL